MDLSMCPNKYNRKMYKMALCTTSQFGNRVQHQDVIEWLEYHRLIGVEHVFWRDRTNHGRNAKGSGPNNATLRPYIDEGFVSYNPGPYHPPFDWGSVYSDQLYTNAACYMRLRHAVEWIATVDMDELIEVQHEGGVGIEAKNKGPIDAVRPAEPWHLREMLDSLPGTINEVTAAPMRRVCCARVRAARGVHADMVHHTHACSRLGCPHQHAECTEHARARANTALAIDGCVRTHGAVPWCRWRSCTAAS